MKRNCRTKVSAVLLVILSAFMMVDAQHRATPEALDSKITVDLEKQPLGMIFRKLIYDYKIPIGFEESTLDSDHNDFFFEVNPPIGQVHPSFGVKQKWITIKVKEASLSDVLATLVVQLGNYRWEIDGGVVNIIPSKGRDVRYQQLLDSRIREFTFEQGMPVGMLREQVRAIPEIKAFLRSTNLNMSDLRNPYGDPSRPVSEDITEANVTLKELLNSIVRRKGGGWFIRSNKTVNPKGKEFLELEL
ncbi:MAG: hypothetical protein AB7Q37_09625 [Pyrinomonadaceae bacterium]